MLSRVVYDEAVTAARAGMRVLLVDDSVQIGGKARTLMMWPHDDHAAVVAAAGAFDTNYDSPQQAVVTVDMPNIALTAVPAGLQQLKRLTSLNIRDNNITALPHWLGDVKLMPSLQTLLVRGNPLSGELGLFAAKSEESVLGYLRGLQDSVGVRRVQVVVVGDYMQGKTSILQCLKAKLGLGLLPTRVELKDHDRTLAVTFSEYQDKESGVVWSLCDFPGQQQFYSTNIRFMSADRTIFCWCAACSANISLLPTRNRQRRVACTASMSWMLICGDG